MGGEVALGSVFINYLGLEDVKGFIYHAADKFLAFYWSSLMILQKLVSKKERLTNRR